MRSGDAVTVNSTKRGETGPSSPLIQRVAQTVQLNDGGVLHVQLLLLGKQARAHLVGTPIPK